MTMQSPEKVHDKNEMCAAPREAVMGLAVGLPKHRVVPYPNIPKRLYPLNAVQDGRDG